MKSAFVFALALCFAVSALSVPSATDAPAEEFDKNATTTRPTTTTPTTTKSTTATTTKSTTATTTKSTTPTTTPTTTKSTTATTTPTTTKSTTPTTTPTTTKSTTPTTTPTTTKSTTPTTTPTTTKPTTPAPPKPTPPANLTVGNYTVKSDKTVICLMAQMALQIRLVTPKENGTFIVQPQEKMTTVEGFCKGAKANLTLVFKEGFITFMFNKTATDVYVDALSLSLSYPLTKDGHMPYIAKNNSMHLFAAKVGHSYSCKSDSVYLGNGLSLEVTQDRMQAFNLTKSNEFGSPEPCPADRPDYRVAIAVGVTLLVLIVIVVVAYLLGRRRRADGYQSL